MNYKIESKNVILVTKYYIIEANSKEEDYKKVKQENCLTNEVKTELFCTEIKILNE